jgi:GT2 family glycosyltransferase
LLFTPDAIRHRGALDGMVAHLQAHPALGMVGPRLLNPDGSLQISAHPRPTLGREAWRLFHLDRFWPRSCYGRRFWQQTEAQAVEVLMGACLLLRREAVDAVGLFDERFFMYSEEVDLCKRFRAAGWGIDYLPTVQVTHYGGQSTRQVAEAMFLELYRSKVLYFRKHEGERVAAQYKRLLWLAALARRLTGGERGRRYRLLMEHLGGF